MINTIITRCQQVFGRVHQRFTFLTQWTVMCVLGAWLIYGVPYQLGSASEQAAERAVYRLMSGIYDASESEDNILVVLFNDQSIENLYPYLRESNDWPLAYSDQASILTTIMSLQPLGIFYDVAWMKQRSLDNSYSRAIEQLKAMAQTTQIPLWFARGAVNSNMAENVKQDLTSFAHLAINGWQGQRNLYPLYSAESPTIATMLYNVHCQQHACEGIKDSNASPMSVRWNANTAPILLPHRSEECREKKEALQTLALALKSIIWNIIPGLDEQSQLQLCPAQRVMYIDEVIAMARSQDVTERDRIKAIVEGSLVLVGGQIEGVQDYVVSPVHGSLPGVFFHAMALDNLMTFGENYTREDDQADHINFAIWLLYLTLLIFVRRFATQHSALLWLNQRLWLLSGLYIVGVFSVVFWGFNYAPSSWISILALGWVGIQLITKIESYYVDPDT
ncbi:CHASE2 domain-containing protein [Vibrio sp. TH_r3]|uniref:CHASE2 domain-containing protein n=1 Tax=Vibrio sp. TH_r3 TaxID=3082084 RepID=UPI0029539EF7|nr:CHASE2 domain-containing protein [Vibrio sp. TH_r3]MDV7105537.1 CHASE2 domain-containing protein [Vibrio sp. TH_r3]